jgi:hypothetical protein
LQPGFFCLVSATRVLLLTGCSGSLVLHAEWCRFHISTESRPCPCSSSFTYRTKYA